MTVIDDYRAMRSRAAARDALVEATDPRAGIGRVLSHADVDRLAGLWASELRGRGLSHGDRLVIVLPNRLEFAVLYFACLHGGVVAVPINPDMPVNEARELIAISDARSIVVDAATRAVVPAGTGLDIIDIDAEADVLGRLDGSGGAALAFAAAAGDLASITFTSGTTGRPKGVCHRNDVLLANARAFNNLLDFGDDRRFLHVMPMFYMAGYLNTLLSPAIAGAAAVLAPRFDASGPLWFWRVADAARADTFWLSPTMLKGLLMLDRDRRADGHCRDLVRTICVGTAPLTSDIKSEFEGRFGVEILQSYGMSELLYITANTERFPRIDGSVGRLLAGIEAKATDENGETCPPGVDGRIAFRSEYVPAGILNYNSGEVEPTGQDEWWDTGDLGCIDAAGNLFITGREKDLIIRGGTNISPAAIEAVLRAHASVDDVAVIGVPHDFYGEEVVAVIKPRDGLALNDLRDDLTEYCRARMPRQSVPTRFVATTDFPTGSTGKIQKPELVNDIQAGRL
jgi:acyl-CoA synthetase (AMP-forming)/AMP-acid ligase II